MNITLDTDVLAKQITQAVVEELKPLLHLKAGPNDVIFSVPELAEYMRMSTKWVYDHTHELPHFKMGGSLRFKKKDIDKLIEQECLKIHLNNLAGRNLN